MPHFIAGIMYGMTTENNLKEIEACYTGAQIMYPEVQYALDEFAKGGWDNELQAIFQLGIVILQIP